MVKPFFILTVALVLQYASITHAAEPNSTQRDTNAIYAKLKIDLELARNQTGTAGMGVAIIHKGKLVFAEGFGKRNKKDPFTPETRSMLASVTKAFTATSVAELVAEGKMDWDTTPVNTYLPVFETHDPVLTSQLTMQDLLSHRTPLPGFDTTWVWSNETRRDLIKRIRHVEVKPKLGVAVNYNNVMYCVAGEAAANVAGIPLEQLVRNKILKPLGFSSMGFTRRELSKSPNHALPYTAASFDDALAGRFIEVDMLDDAVEKRAAAGDMYSNVLDLARWGQIVMKGGMLNGKQVLNKEGIEATLTAHNIAIPENRDPDFGLSIQYGMGWMLNSYKGNNFYEHSGGSYGYVTNLALFPNADLVIAHLSNVELTALPRCASFHIADEILGLRKTRDWLTKTSIELTKNAFAMYEAMAKGSFPDRVPNKPPAHALIEYAGEYYHPGFGTATVRLERGQLHITFAAFKGVLTHYHFDAFTTVFEHTPAKIGRLVTFSTGPDGKVSGTKFATIEDEEYYYEKKK
ncbi:hypothetical protein BGZ82_008629 [Podila clonocystis]|nr:hypothetical protein BGZ82_008629 [Podila clonocystis]